MDRDLLQILTNGRKREKKALAMRRKGATFQEIGYALGVSRQRAHAMVCAAEARNGKRKG